MSTEARRMTRAQDMVQSRTTPRFESHVRGVEEDNALLTSSSIIALDTAFASETPTSENALLTLSLLAQLLGGGTGLSYEAIVSTRMLLNATSGTIATEIQAATLAADVAQTLLKDVLVSAERLWILSREYQAEMDMPVASQILGALATAVQHLMRSELVGDLIELHSCAQDVATCTLSSVSETVDVSLLAGVPVPTSAGKDALRAIISNDTIAQVEALQALRDAAGLLDVHVQRLDTFWGFADGEILLSQLYVFSATSGGIAMMESVDLVEDGRILLHVPLDVHHLLASGIAVKLLAPALRDNQELYPALQALDNDGDKMLSPQEMLLDFSLLMQRYLFWECLEWASGAWTSSTCTEMAAGDGTFVTCACSNPGTFAVGLRSAGSCGDGRVTDGEECDDNNADPGDGCSADCLVESNYFCLDGDTVTPSNCSFGRADCPTMFLGPNCEYMCSQSVVDLKCLGTKFLPTASATSAVDGAKGGMIFVSSGARVWLSAC